MCWGCDGAVAADVMGRRGLVCAGRLVLAGSWRNRRDGARALDGAAASGGEAGNDVGLQFHGAKGVRQFDRGADHAGEGEDQSQGEGGGGHGGELGPEDHGAGHEGADEEGADGGHEQEEGIADEAGAAADAEGLIGEAFEDGEGVSGRRRVPVLRV